MAAVDAVADQGAADGSQFIHAHSCGERRRQARRTLEAKLASAYKRVRALELQLVQRSAGDAIDDEVDARLQLARPALHTLVSAAVATDESSEVPQRQVNLVSGAARAFRNFSLHSDFGCGAAALPTSSSEAKYRARGRRRQSDRADQGRLNSEVTCEPGLQSSSSEDCSDTHRSDVSFSGPPEGTCLYLTQPQLASIAQTNAALVGDSLKGLLRDECQTAKPISNEAMDSWIDGLH
eukprot:TRINITY_DN80308_c0_g1_i1.p1 TRINITY_DN80308_c0_g1~~TRINITY_DN80308_c0_g1_i1.p1  ORF type:complete len:237 (+),score=46.41 TRINITY_DN80308_c0_g1_i1:51-761(+)